MHSRKSRYITTTATTTVTTATLKSVGVTVMVIGIVMMWAGPVEGDSSSRGGVPDLRRLWERVTSHTETLRNISRYLKQTDIFWGWFQKNKERLDDILSADHSFPPPGNDRLLQRLEEMERKQKVQDEDMKKLKHDLQEERKKTTRLEAILLRQEETGDILRSEIPELEERIKQVEEQLVAVNQTTDRNKRDLDGRVTTDIYNLQQDLGVVVQSQSTTRDGMSDLRGLLDGVMINAIFPLQEQMIQLNQSHIALSEEANQEISNVKAEIRTLSQKVSSKQVGSDRGLHKRINNLQDQIASQQTQITHLQTSDSTIQGKIAEHDGRFSAFQNINPLQEQLQEALEEHARLDGSVSRLRNRILELENVSGYMNLEFKKITIGINELEKDVTNLKQYNNFTHPVRRIRVPNAKPTSLQPIGPPGTGFEGAFGRPGNQGWRGEPGDPGSRGLPGTPGAPGDRGAPGSPGLRGEQGNPGSRGSPGNRGAPGNPGSMGTPGVRGAPGIPGVPGSPGLRGVPGSPGLRGAPGDQGGPGSPGSRGAPGGRGAPGNPGSSGVRGSPGIPGNAGLRGLAGSPGMRGAPGNPGYLGGSSYPGSREYTSYRASPTYAAYSVTPSYGRYPNTARYGRHY